MHHHNPHPIPRTALLYIGILCLPAKVLSLLRSALRLSVKNPYTSHPDAASAVQMPSYMQALWEAPNQVSVTGFHWRPSVPLPCQREPVPHISELPPFFLPHRISNTKYRIPSVPKSYSTVPPTQESASHAFPWHAVSVRALHHLPPDRPVFDKTHRQSVP